MKCEICRENEATYLVILHDENDSYTYKQSQRCDECVKIAERSYKNIEIKKLVS